MYILKLYMISFSLFTWFILPNVLRSIAKKIFLIVIFLYPCFDIPKTWNFTSGGEQNCKAKNRRLGMIVRSFQDFKLRKKQISLTFSYMYFLINDVLLYHFLENWLAHNKKMTHIGSEVNLLSSYLPIHFHLQPQFKYEFFHIYFTSFHCTGRYKLNKFTLLPMCGFIAQLVEHCTGITEVTDSNPIEALIFIRLLLSNRLKCLWNEILAPWPENWSLCCTDS